MYENCENVQIKISSKNDAREGVYIFHPHVRNGSCTTPKRIQKAEASPEEPPDLRCSAPFLPHPLTSAWTVGIFNGLLEVPHQQSGPLIR